MASDRKLSAHNFETDFSYDANCYTTEEKNHDVPSQLHFNISFQPHTHLIYSRGIGGKNLRTFCSLLIVKMHKSSHQLTLKTIADF